MNLSGQICVRNISTNPQNPVNTEINDYYGEDVENQFLNSFYFGSEDPEFPNLPPVYLNKKIDWNIPGFDNSDDWIMFNPFGSTHPAFSYLLEPTNSDVNDRDFHWEDGWELLYLNTGYYPDGSDVKNPSPDGLVPFPYSSPMTSAPYIIFTTDILV